MRVDQNAVRLQAHDHAVPLSQGGVRQEVQIQDRNGDGECEDRISGLDHQNIPDHGHPEERLEHEATLSHEDGQFAGTVEVDEAYFAGREMNKNASMKANEGRSTVGKTAVVGAKDDDTQTVIAKVVTSTDKDTLRSFVKKQVAPGLTVYTDDFGVYKGLPYDHTVIKHTLSEYVNGATRLQWRRIAVVDAQACKSARSTS